MLTLTPPRIEPETTRQRRVPGRRYAGARLRTMAKTVALLDYGSGNLRSAQRAVERVGAEVTVTSDPQTVLAADGLLVPGVGAFAACMDGLRAVNGPRLIGERLAGGRPVMGICVGMQVLFEHGVEHGIDAQGCGELAGRGGASARVGAAAHGVEHGGGSGKFANVRGIQQY